MAVLALMPGTAIAQSPDPPPAPDPAVVFSLTDVSHVEAWSFFTPPLGGGDPDYTLLGNRATLRVGVTGRRFDLDGAFEYGQLLNLPARAFGPGPLGPGASHFEATRAPSAYQLYFRALSVRVRDLLPGVTVQAGRMPFRSGATASGAADESAILRRERLEARLIGESEWSMFPRSFDGVRADAVRRGWRATLSLLFPTQGGYEESVNPTISNVRLLTAEGGPDQLQLFAYHYRDRRRARGRPDNSGLAARAADVSIWTFGGSHAGLHRAGPGDVDVVGWAALQGGDWYGDGHRAASVLAEAGYRLRAGWRPWARAGVLYASGDDHPGDAAHNTFFPMLPSFQRYARTQTYAQMNVIDRFAQLRLQPRSTLTVGANLHAVRLASGVDAWYVGPGATAREGAFFGFATRRPFGPHTLGTIVEGVADYRVNGRWSVHALVGWMKGGAAIRRLFAGDRLTVVAIESVLTLSK